MKEVDNRVIYDVTTGNIIHQTGEASGNVVPHGVWGGLRYIDVPYGSLDYTKCYIKEINLDTLEPVIELFPEPEMTEDQQRIKQLEEDILLLQTDAQVGGVL
ncbi:hypothetical protein [Lysinibacillus capsici]|uniref:hypothetical protein n=1 Tax=Lysinibacillus capsici TaxID=2115968 RepID=UPI003081EC48|nr:hypothetical protein ICJ70_01625 [Lysinibacillus capsici]